MTKQRKLLYDSLYIYSYLRSIKPQIMSLKNDHKFKTLRKSLQVLVYNVYTSNSEIKLCLKHITANNEVRYY